MILARIQLLVQNLYYYPAFLKSKIQLYYTEIEDSIKCRLPVGPLDVFWMILVVVNGIVQSFLSFQVCLTFTWWGFMTNVWKAGFHTVGTFNSGGFTGFGIMAFTTTPTYSWNICWTIVFPMIEALASVTPPDEKIIINIAWCETNV